MKNLSILIIISFFSLVISSCDRSATDDIQRQDEVERRDLRGPSELDLDRDIFGAGGMNTDD